MPPDTFLQFSYTILFAPASGARAPARPGQRCLLSPAKNVQRLKQAVHPVITPNSSTPQTSLLIPVPLLQCGHNQPTHPPSSLCWVTLLQARLHQKSAWRMCIPWDPTDTGGGKAHNTLTTSPRWNVRDTATRLQLGLDGLDKAGGGAGAADVRRLHRGRGLLQHLHHRALQPER